MRRTPQASFHTLRAFPESNYGYVDLPAATAEKLTTRINGTVFRGIKVKTTPVEKQDLEKIKRKIKEDGVHPGINLPSDRWVKRAWTKNPVVSIEKNMDKKSAKNARRDDSKCGNLLFQFSLPENMTPTVPDPKDRKAQKRREKEYARAQAAEPAEPAVLMILARILHLKKKTQVDPATSGKRGGWMGWMDEVVMERKGVSDVERKAVKIEEVKDTKPRKDDVEMKCVGKEEENDSSSGSISSGSESDSDDSDRTSQSDSDSDSSQSEKQKLAARAIVTKRLKSDKEIVKEISAHAPVPKASSKAMTKLAASETSASESASSDSDCESDSESGSEAQPDV
ncbi:hypothetical protein BDZ91DRAFT_791181 [Kalaharituber pfeilii]|nr:hypothetical protein BDZ91DRAFT_791181 [Kalaharituber pfeilii]